MTAHLIDFKDIANELVKSHHKHEDSIKLNIKLDPWDNYLYHDSKFILDFLFNKNNELAEDRFILIKFLMFIYHNDIVANFRKEGKAVGDNLVAFLKYILYVISRAQENSKMIYEFVNKSLLVKKEPTNEEIEKFETNLEIIFDLFIDDCTQKKEFSQYKEDYFNI